MISPRPQNPSKGSWWTMESSGTKPAPAARRDEFMPGELHELSIEIGKLTKGLEVLESTVRTNHEESTAEHREVHNIVVSMSESVRNIASDVAEMKPLTEDYREKRAEMRGAARLMNGIYAICGGGAAVAIGKLWDLFSSRPHP